MTSWYIGRGKNERLTSSVRMVSLDGYRPRYGESCMNNISSNTGHLLNPFATPVTSVACMAPPTHTRGAISRRRCYDMLQAAERESDHRSTLSGTSIKKKINNLADCWSGHARNEDALLHKYEMVHTIYLKF